jgi:hypothetical protein
MLSTQATKDAFFAAVADGLLRDEKGNERNVNEVTLLFGQAPLIDVTEWIAEARSAGEYHASQQ